MVGIDFNPFSLEFWRNPYPTYALLREQAPILWRPETQLWYVSRFEDVSNLLRDRRLGRTIDTIQPPAPPQEGLEAFRRLSDYSMFDMEPPDHTRLRRLVSQVFTPKRVEAMRPQVEMAANGLLDRALAKPDFDLLEDYAVPLPVQVIADLLGIPLADRARLRPWSAAIVALYELSHTPEQATWAEQAAVEFWDYLRWLVDIRRRVPQNDLISALVSATDAENGTVLSENELIATCILLLNAGHEATVNGFGNGMYALFMNPSQFEILAASPSDSLVRSAVEEMLRFDSPLQLFKRWVREDLDYQGLHFQSGQQIVLFFGSANRDPARFKRPDEMDITRAENPHISFGAGIHFCLGAPLARLELTTALAALFRRAPRLRLLEMPQWRSSFVIRGLKSLQVSQ
jgi:cytochrome P450